MKTKTFDCVDMKRKGGDRVYQKVKDMTREEELAFWQRGTEELKTEIENRKKGKQASPK